MTSACTPVRPFRQTPTLRRLVLASALGVLAALSAAESSKPEPAAAGAKDLATEGGTVMKFGALNAGKILFLGNSITLHGPAPAIGWTGNWGMAASAQDKDYVHLMLSAIAKAAGGTPMVRVDNIADIERQYATIDIAARLKDHLAFRPDIVVLAIGENTPALASAEAKQAFLDSMVRLLTALKQSSAPAIFVRSCFWADAAKDDALRQACAVVGGTFVDISSLGREPANSARSERAIEHAGVAGHPGDRGMQAIATAILTAMESHK